MKKKSGESELIVKDYEKRKERAGEKNPLNNVFVINHVGFCDIF